MSDVNKKLYPIPWYSWIILLLIVPFAFPLAIIGALIVAVHWCITKMIGSEDDESQA